MRNLLAGVSLPYKNTPVMVGVFSVVVDIVERCHTYFFVVMFVFVTSLYIRYRDLEKSASSMMKKTTLLSKGQRILGL